MKPTNYFNQEKADDDDMQLQMAIHQGYIPKTCLLAGPVVMGLINSGKDPCNGCLCPRIKCNGRGKEPTI